MNKETDAILDAMLEVEEGFSSKVYKCSEDRDSAGFGYNLEANPLHLSNREIVSIYEHGITRERAKELLDGMEALVISQLQKNLPYYNALPEKAQLVLVDMTYNLGLAGILKFKDFFKELKEGDYQGSAEEMLDSLWARQVKGRSKKLAKIMAEIKK